MKRQLPLGSEGSDHGMTRTGSSAEASTDHSASINDYLSAYLRGSLERAGDRLCVGKDEAQERVFGPVAVVVGGGVGLREEGAVATLGGLEEGDVGVGHDLFASVGRDADEGIVGR